MMWPLLAEAWPDVRRACGRQGVTVLFDTVLTDAECTDGKIQNITIFNESGYSRIHAAIFVDGTGDADLCLHAGAPTVTRGNYHTYCPLTATLDTCRKVVEKEDIGLLTANNLRWGSNTTPRINRCGTVPMANRYPPI